MIDIHSHIIPGLDDGSKDLETSIKMIERAIKCNTRAIVATPHYYRGYFETPFDIVAEEVEMLKREIKKRGINIDLYPGQEVFLDKYTVQMYKNGQVKGNNGSRYLLIELPMGKYSESYIESIYEMKLMGAVPVIAHPERYRYIINNVNNINPFIEEGCLFQINTGSITGLFGKEVQKTAQALIENGICSFVASDAHSANVDGRCTGLEHAMKLVEKINKSVAKDSLINGELMLRDENIIRNYHKISVKKSFFNFLK